MTTMAQKTTLTATTAKTDRTAARDGLRVAIVGAGAIGGFIGTRLAHAGQARVSAVARGATLAALQQHGWRMDTAEGRLQAPVTAAGSAADLGVQDLVIIAVKAPALPALAPSLSPLLGPDTVVMPAMNGVPWWFGQGIAGLGNAGLGNAGLGNAGLSDAGLSDAKLAAASQRGSRPDDARLRSVDPDGRIAGAIAYRRVLGCVVHASTSTPEPGLVQHRMGRGLIIGEPDGGRSDRVDTVVALLNHAGFDATASPRIRYDIWYKLWGNMTMNPVSALTGATIDRILGDARVRQFCSAAMDEAALIGARIGCAIDQTAEDRHAVTAKLGAFKTSMLQDVEADRAIELDALVGAVLEIGQRLGVATPAIAALFGLTRLFGQVRGLYPDPAPGSH